jgi:hypothetical protein
MRGVIDLQPTGADLLLWMAEQQVAGAPDRLSSLLPSGLGMSSLQRSRFVFLVNRVGIAKPRKTHAEVFTFRFAGSALRSALTRAGTRRTEQARLWRRRLRVVHLVAGRFLEGGNGHNNVEWIQQ